jgi:glutamate-5-semialdehyde dehydrogenase
LAGAYRSQKDAALYEMRRALLAATDAIVRANGADLQAGRSNGLSEALLDRLALDEQRIAAMASSLSQLAGLADPVGEVVRGSTLPNGLRLRQVRVPMGVIGMVYEARPNVSVDGAALGLKSGNAVILRGGSAAERTNAVIVEVLAGAVSAAGLPADCVASIDRYGREGVRALMRARGLVDLLVPRGGAGLIDEVVRESLVPVIATGVGNCHVYVDGAADQEKALAIVLNSKLSRPSVCNAAETLLVDWAIAAEFLPRVLAELADAGVLLHVDERAAAHLPPGAAWQVATSEDWATETRGLEMADGVVDGIDQAVDHIQRYSSGHTEAICTEELGRAEQFIGAIDSAAVMVNASTRFTDGGMFGFGAEMGISTQKLHARGPLGLAELTTTKWIALGDGQIR